MICGQYELDGHSGSLIHVDTGQSIRKLSADGEAWRFEYRDGDATIAFAVSVDTPRSGIASVDFNRWDMQSFRLGYGLWRRVSFFLLDGLIAWFFVVEGAQEKTRSVKLIGGWQNGLWNRSLILQGGGANSNGERAQAGRRFSADALCPLDREPPAWRYIPVASVLPEVALHTVPGLGTVPTLDQSAPIFRQIAGAPQFARDDGKAFLFHRFVQAHFHRGEDYDPQPYYGYVNDSVAFTMNAQRPYGVRSFLDPILASPSVEFDGWFAGEWPSYVLRPAPILREELTFALVDIQGVISQVNSTLPMILERDRERLESYRSFPVTPEEEQYFRGIRFGQYLNMIMGWHPESSLGITTTSSASHGGRSFLAPNL